jgi:hypothetical protein
MTAPIVAAQPSGTRRFQGKSTPRRTWSPYDDNTSRVFGKLSLGTVAELAARPGAVSLEMRVWMNGIRRLGSNGHSPFRSDELVLAKVGGEIYTDRAIREAIKKLRDGLWLAPSSSRKCLVYPSEVVDCPMHDGDICPECGHAKRWSNRTSSWADSSVYQRGA